MSKVKNSELKRVLEEAFKTEFVEFGYKLAKISDIGVDGVDHINIYNPAATDLGRALSPKQGLPFDTPLGRFVTMLGFTSFIVHRPFKNEFRNSKPIYFRHIKAGCEYGRAKHYKAMVTEAYLAKITQNPALLKVFKESTLPLDSYYRDNGTLTRTNSASWLLPVLTMMREDLRGDTTPDLKQKKYLILFDKESRADTDIWHDIAGDLTLFNLEQEITNDKEPGSEVKPEDYFTQPPSPTEDIPNEIEEEYKEADDSNIKIEDGEVILTEPVSDYEAYWDEIARIGAESCQKWVDVGMDINDILQRPERTDQWIALCGQGLAVINQGKDVSYEKLMDLQELAFISSMPYWETIGELVKNETGKLLTDFAEVLKTKTPTLENFLTYHRVLMLIDSKIHLPSLRGIDLDNSKPGVVVIRTDSGAEFSIYKNMATFTE